MPSKGRISPGSVTALAEAVAVITRIFVQPHIQTILTVIGRRTRTFENRKSQYLDLRNTNLQGADLGGAQLQGADLATVENLTQDQINQACTDENTKLPRELRKPPPCPPNLYASQVPPDCLAPCRSGCS